jgi:hypothetical protein
VKDFKDIFKQLLIKLGSSIIFLFLLILLSASVLTGEFPPKISHIKTQYSNFLEMKETYLILIKKASEKVKMAEAQSHSVQPDQQVTELIHEIQANQSQLNIKMGILIEQNRLILNKLNSPAQK